MNLKVFKPWWTERFSRKVILLSLVMQGQANWFSNGTEMGSTSYRSCSTPSQCTFPLCRSTHMILQQRCSLLARRFSRGLYTTHHSIRIGSTPFSINFLRNLLILVLEVSRKFHSVSLQHNVRPRSSNGFQRMQLSSTYRYRNRLSMLPTQEPKVIASAILEIKLEANMLQIKGEIGSFVSPFVIF